MKIVLGVEEILYQGRRSVRGKSNPRILSTGDIASILEDKYHVMELFVTNKSDEIVQSLEPAFEEALDEALGSVMADPDSRFEVAFGEIENSFRNFINSRGLDGNPGIPTKASLIGMLQGRRTRKLRPSFVETGLYLKSFRVWRE